MLVFRIVVGVGCLGGFLRNEVENGSETMRGVGLGIQWDCVLEGLGWWSLRGH